MIVLHMYAVLTAQLLVEGDVHTTNQNATQICFRL